jgi:predicted nucleotidyltransferase
MGNIFNQDFRDFIQSLNDCGVKYILVGGYSVILHGYSRTTGDMDIWVERSLENYQTLKRAFLQFGMPVFVMSEEAFLTNDKLDVFTFGNPPSSIDIMVAVKGLNFEECYNNAIYFEEDGLLIRTIYINDLISAKKAANRAKDINDLENLIP